MNSKKALTKNQFSTSGFDVSEYKLIKTEGVFYATLDHKVWGKRWLNNYFTLDDGRKILAATFYTDNCLGMKDIPLGSKLCLTFKLFEKSGSIYLRKVELINKTSSIEDVNSVSDD